MVKRAKVNKAKINKTKVKKVKVEAPVIEKAQPEALLKCGFVSIIGRPNTGKSTLLNQIVGEKVAIVSPIPQTTRTAIRGILTDERGQIVFVDTPGWHSGRDGLDRFMNKSCQNSIEGVDCVVYVVDTSRAVGPEEEQIAQRLKHVKVPIVMALNKTDLRSKYLHQYLELWETTRQQKLDTMKDFVMIPVSGRSGTQVDKLVDVVFDFLPLGHFFYETDIVSDMSQKQLVSDIIREKLFLLTREELPHSIAVVIDELRPVKGKTTRIRAVIYVERDSQKEIVIGAKGQMLKKVGTMAREELEVLLETKVFIELHVKARKDWRDDHGMLADMGYILEL
ncbi:MAG: GTPase Era [Candidatus Omnitrophica bacterium]|nr:GTPase Era [Candidatus Omnitrophota bacterium]